MVKSLGIDPDEIRHITCKKCYHKLEYIPSDIASTDDSHYDDLKMKCIQCPNCEYRIVLGCSRC